MMNQFVTRKIWSGDEMLKKCEKNYEAFKEFWKTSGLRGHFVLFDNPRHWQKFFVNLTIFSWFCDFWGVFYIFQHCDFPQIFNFSKFFKKKFIFRFLRKIKKMKENRKIYKESLRINFYMEYCLTTVLEIGPKKSHFQKFRIIFRKICEKNIFKKILL